MGLDHDRDRGPVQVGKHVDRQLCRLAATVDDQHDGQRQHEHAVFQAERKDVVEHRPCSPTRADPVCLAFRFDGFKPGGAAGVAVGRRVLQDRDPGQHAAFQPPVGVGHFDPDRQDAHPLVH